ncbi:MAG: hypothetical protein Q9222_003587 [Ikaeria aurantiellina]
MPYSDAMPLSPVDVVAKFINWFSNYILERINQNHVRVQGRPITDVADVMWILTIPANWEESSNDLREAARVAGLGEVQLVSETEAAAALMLGKQTFPVRQQISGQADESILVLDVGGGTYNIITYIVKSNGSMEEGIHGTGGLSGAYWLNQKFREYLERRLEHQLPRLMEDRGKETNTNTCRTFLNDCVELFEDQKKFFNGFSQDQDDISRHRNDLRPSTPADRQRYYAADHTLQRQFPIFKDPAHLLLWRSSNSDHVRNVIASLFSDEKTLGYRIEVITPPTATSEVVVARGAILKTLRVETINKRFSRRSFGVVQDQIFDAEIHGDAKPVKDVEDNVFRVPDRAVWLSRAGEQVEATVPRTHRGWRCLFLQKSSIITELLISREGALEDGVDVNDGANGIMMVGRLNVDVAAILDRLEIKRNPQTGRKFRFLQYEMRVYVDHLSRTFEIVIPEDGRFPTN